MKDYSKGFIYRVFSDSSGLQGFGSSAETLEIREGRYKRSYKHWLKTGRGTNYSMYKVMKHPDWNMEEIEKYPCANRTELELREGYYHRNFECVNERVAGRTPKERVANWRKNNPEKAKESQDKYTAKNLKPITCDLCGIQTSKLHLFRHQKTAKCQRLKETFL